MFGVHVASQNILSFPLPATDRTLHFLCEWGYNQKWHKVTKGLNDTNKQINNNSGYRYLLMDTLHVLSKSRFRGVRLAAECALQHLPSRLWLTPCRLCLTPQCCPRRKRSRGVYSLSGAVTGSSAVTQSRDFAAVFHVFSPGIIFCCHLLPFVICSHLLSFVIFCHLLSSS